VQEGLQLNNWNFCGLPSKIFLWIYKNFLQMTKWLWKFTPTKIKMYMVSHVCIIVHWYHHVISISYIHHYGDTLIQHNGCHFVIRVIFVTYSWSSACHDMALLYVMCHECLCHASWMFMSWYECMLWHEILPHQDENNTKFWTRMEILDAQYPSLCSQTMYFSISN